MVAMLSRSLCACFAVWALLLSSVIGSRVRMGQASRREQKRAQHLVEQRKVQARNSPNTTDYRFYNEKSSKYYIESMPEVNFDLGEIYSGLVPVKDNASRALFFVFEPKIGDPVDEVTIWLNGGPGCSSLEGFFQENGRVQWQPGTFAPVENPYSWVNLTNMLWVEQPVGTGFSIGDVTATTEEEIAQDFISFFKNWQQIFGVKNFKIYVTGESYAGRYVPYISAAMLEQEDKEYYDLSGALVYDPVIGDFTYTQEEVVAKPYAEAYQNILGLNSTFMETIAELDKSCGYADFRDKYLTYPPPGVQPPVYFNASSEADCDVFSMIDYAALAVNPCFNIYEINQQCPLLWDVIGFPTQLVYVPDGADVYFNRSDVKKAIHAPEYVDWAECAAKAVFVGGNSVADGAYYDGGPEGEGDLSADPIQKVLPYVIEKTNRVLVSNGDFDMIIISNGTLLAIQNMTWNGKLGFQEQPSTPINITYPDLQYAAVFAENGAEGIDGPQGITGIQHYERGLMWASTTLAGHMQPQFQPRTTYRHLQWVLGRVETL